MWVKTVLVFLGAAALATSAAAQNKSTGTAQCKPDPPVPVEIGDKPGHFFAIGKALWIAKIAASASVGISPSVRLRPASATALVCLGS